MASEAYVIVEGRVTRRDERSGSKKRDDGTVNNWAMSIITVLVEETGTAELVLPSNTQVIGGLDPVKGDDVRFLCHVRRSQYGFDLNIVGLASGALDASSAAAYAGADS